MKLQKQPGRDPRTPKVCLQEHPEAKPKDSKGVTDERNNIKRQSRGGSGLRSIGTSWSRSVVPRPKGKMTQVKSATSRVVGPRSTQRAAYRSASSDREGDLGEDEGHSPGAHVPNTLKSSKSCKKSLGEKQGSLPGAHF